MPGFLASVVRGVEQLYCWSNREPWLTLRRVLWVLTFGWALAVVYTVYAGGAFWGGACTLESVGCNLLPLHRRRRNTATAAAATPPAPHPLPTPAAALLLSLVFAPFSWQALRLALLALDGGITLEPAADYIVLSLEVKTIHTRMLLGAAGLLLRCAAACSPARPCFFVQGGPPPANAGAAAALTCRLLSRSRPARGIHPHALRRPPPGTTPPTPSPLPPTWCGRSCLDGTSRWRTWRRRQCRR